MNLPHHTGPAQSKSCLPPGTNAGGYRPFAVPHTLLPWTSYKQGRTCTLGLRTYLALSESQQRRAFTTVRPTYTARECAALLGNIRPRLAAHAIEDLQSVRLVDFQPHHLQFAAAPEEVPGLDLHTYEASLAHVHPSRRTACIPRRMVRYLAREGSPALIATVFGVALRCRYHAATGRYAGTLSPDWLADTFTLSERTAYRSLETLEDLTYLLREETPSSYTRQYGRKYRINSTWTPPSRPTSPRPTRRLPAPDPRQKLAASARAPRQKLAASAPSDPATTPEAAPSYPFQEGRSYNQRDLLPRTDPAPEPLPPPDDPAPRHHKPSGVVLAHRSQETPQLSPPTLNLIVLEDLQDTRRLLTLYEQVLWLKIMSRSPATRLTFVALAVHALRVTRDNACALFRTLLRRKDYWTFITDGDDAVAQARLNAYEHLSDQARHPPPSSAAPRSLPHVTRDALQVRALTLQMGGELDQGEVLEWLRTKDPATWTLAHVRDVAAEAHAVDDRCNGACTPHASPRTARGPRTRGFVSRVRARG